VRREQEATDGRRVKAKCGIVESNEGDHHDNDDDDDNNEDRIENDIERLIYRILSYRPPCGFLLFCCGDEKTAMLT